MQNVHTPKISFGIIVLNGEPFTKYTLRTIYPYAHQIIISEGAAPAARNIATQNGHSRDGTLDALRRFKSEEDPENKIIILTAEDEGYSNGFWPGEKHEQSRAYSKRATGNYLWQVDIDEYYKDQDIKNIISILEHNPEISGMTFKQITFWGGLDYVVDGWYLRRGATNYRRLFKWGQGYEYKTHRPPTVIDDKGQDLTKLPTWWNADRTTKEGFLLYHYSLLLPKQVLEKCDYYGNAEWAKRSGAIKWAAETYMNLRKPYRVHNVYDFPSWLEFYKGGHPEQIKAMLDNLKNSESQIELRNTLDIDRLLNSQWYQMGRKIFQYLDTVDRKLPKKFPKLYPFFKSFLRLFF